MQYKNDSKFLIQAKSLYSKYSFLLPWVSLLWGVISSFLLTRDYTKTIRLSVFTFAFLFFIVTMSTWYSFIKNSTHEKINNLKKIQKSLHKRKDLLEFLGSTATQYFVQYIFMFCIPFMYFKQEWIWFIFLIVFALFTIWDPLWTKLFRYSFFRLLLRLLAFCMAFSFSYAVLFPKNLDTFYIWLAVVSFVIVFPWSGTFIQKKLKRSEILSTFFISILMIAHLFLPNDLKFPLLSIWMENAHFSFEKPRTARFQIMSEDQVNRNFLLNKLNSDIYLCSISPIIAPIGISYEIVHEWYVDDQFVDKISLPTIVGLKNNDRYKTFSCKKFFPNIKEAKKITCKTFLKNGIYVGQASLFIKSD
ncbi:DUF2914 domain-containing protein [Fluviispira multicolorata]|uniref:DUF2914 domain-containing protein n=1 Tax=Fluviispira multicolorata TaxID=2654512 RepID=A0A833JCY3_9BACT|nr:DUF2914 domain-containing protein [Fluviispira multicolorata]KAB8030837.1 DUF2914 domain-containing protein [Fluviispira multicolorata]